MAPGNTPVVHHDSYGAECPSWVDYIEHSAPSTELASQALDVEIQARFRADRTQAWVKDMQEKHEGEARIDEAAASTGEGSREDSEDRENVLLGMDSFHDDDGSTVVGGCENDERASIDKDLKNGGKSDESVDRDDQDDPDDSESSEQSESDIDISDMKGMTIEQILDIYVVTLGEITTEGEKALARIDERLKATPSTENPTVVADENLARDDEEFGKHEERAEAAQDSGPTPPLLMDKLKELDEVVDRVEKAKDRLNETMKAMVQEVAQNRQLQPRDHDKRHPRFLNFERRIHEFLEIVKQDSKRYAVFAPSGARADCEVFSARIEEQMASEAELDGIYSDDFMDKMLEYFQILDEDMREVETASETGQQEREDGK